MKKGDKSLCALIEEVKKQLNETAPNENVMLGRDLTLQILKKLEEAENQREDAEISVLYGNRAQLPKEQWIEKDPNMSTLDWMKSLEEKENK